MSQFHITVGDLKKAIKDLPDDTPLIYSHDDEGNEYQGVIYLPNIKYVKKSDGYRFLDIVDIESEDQIKEGVIKCLCVN